MMKAAILTEHNKPLEIKDVPVPEPGTGQVRIRMIASGVCGTDLHVIRGLFPATLPLVLGHEPVGIVEKLGVGVTRLQVGDRVGVCWQQSGCGHCVYCEKKQEQFCREAKTWLQNGGGHSEYMIAEAAGCTRLPAEISWEAAAPIFCAGFTVMSGYRNAAPRPGDRVAVIGIGGLGHLALQIAKAMGHQTIGITGTESKRKEIEALGADEVLVVKEHAGRELMQMGGADVVLSTSNSMTQNTQVLEGLLPEGRMVSMAVSAEPLLVHPAAVLMSQVSVKTSVQNKRADLVDMLHLAAQGKVKPKLELYGFNEVNKAIERLDQGRVRYRAVILHQS
jgi:D-arabinose 1-dehydrogenase-like Zn-dependent alcohol dehydrogenase